MGENKDKIFEELANTFPFSDSPDYWDSPDARRTGWYDQGKFNQDLFDWYDKYLGKHRTVKWIDWEDGDEL